MSEQIRVELDHGGTAVFVGTAYFHIARGHISTTFKYSDEYVGPDFHNGSYPGDVSASRI